MKNKYIIGGLIFCFLLGMLFKILGYGFSIQTSNSMPKGIYFIAPIQSIHRGDVIVFKPPQAIDQFLIQHHWVPESGILMKNVFGVPGDFVCKKNHFVFINGEKTAYVFDEYLPNKKLPNQPFCAKLKTNEYLLMSTRVKRSFDGRYFGIIHREAMMGAATKL
jgi:conjugative transfer signal peptidase TraF